MSQFRIVSALDGHYSDESEENTQWVGRQYDRSVYEILEFAQTEHSCLSFDFIRGPLYENDQSKDEKLSIYLVAGSEAFNGYDTLAVMRISNIHRSNKVRVKKNQTGVTNTNPDDDSKMELDSDEEYDVECTRDFPKDGQRRKSFIEYVSLPHRGVCNRIKCTNLGSVDGSDRPVAASWSNIGNVYIWDMQFPVKVLWDPALSTTANRKKLKRTEPLFVQDAHEEEGYALDWSSIVAGSLLTGDNTGQIKALLLRDGTTWQEHSSSYKWHKKSVEDIQWSPCEANVFASASVDRSIAIWDTRVSNTCQLFVSDAHTSDVNVISWNKIEQYLLVSGGDDGRLLIWDLRALSSARSTLSAKGGVSTSSGGRFIFILGPFAGCLKTSSRKRT